MDQRGESGSREDPLAFLAGGGEMGERTRAFDWSRSPVGSVEAWPQGLRTAVNICLNSRFPMVISWGQPAYTMFYNDAFIQQLSQKRDRSVHVLLLATETQSGQGRYRSPVT
jgi:hypothetical protein